MYCLNMVNPSGWTATRVSMSNIITELPASSAGIVGCLDKFEKMTINDKKALSPKNESEPFMMQEKTPLLPAAQALNLSTMVTGQPGAIVSRTLVKKDSGTITLFAFDAGQALSEHTAPFDALVHVLAGRLELTIGGKPVIASAGEIVLLPADVPHALTASEPSKMLLVMIRGR